MMVFDLKFVDDGNVISQITHSTWDTEEHAVEAGNIMGFGRILIRSRKVFNEVDLARILEEYWE